MARLRMVESIAHGLTGNAVDLVAENRMQVSWRAFHDKTKSSGVPGGQFVTQGAQRLCQIVFYHRGGTQIVDSLAALNNGLISYFESFFEHFLCFARRKPVDSDLKMEHQALKALQQRVVQLAGDAQALIDTAFEVGVERLCDLMKPVAIQPPEQRQNSGHARRPEPTGLIVGRGDGKLQRVAGLVPDTAVVAGHNAEAVVAWSKIGILRLAVVDDFLPVRILALQLIAKMNLLRGTEGQSRIIDPHIADQSRQVQSARCIISLAVRLHFFNVYRWRESIQRNVFWVDDTGAFNGQEPQTPVLRFGCMRTVRSAPNAQNSIGTVKNGHLNGLRWAVDPLVQCLPTDSREAARQVQPQCMSVVFDDCLDLRTRQTVHCRQGGNATVFYPAQTAARRHPQRTVMFEVKIPHHALGQAFTTGIGSLHSMVTEM